MHKICLIEDDQIMGESLMDRFGLEQFDCEWHQHGQSALQALRSGDYALVISDIRLPDITGDRLFEKLMTENCRLAPFIFITGQGDIEMAVKLLKMGAQDYITKPFDLDALVEKIQTLVHPHSKPGIGELGQSAGSFHPSS